MGDMFPILQSPGRDPSLSDVWNNMYNGFAIAVANTLSQLCVSMGLNLLIFIDVRIKITARSSFPIFWFSHSSYNLTLPTPNFINTLLMSKGRWAKSNIEWPLGNHIGSWFQDSLFYFSFDYQPHALVAY